MDPRIEQAILQITTSFREELPLAALAQAAGLSAFHFHRLFKAETGETPAGYLSRVRIEHAAHLIVVLSETALVQIAFDSGFSSAATFARAFRLHYGVSPSQYRAAKALVVNTSSAPISLQLCQLPTRHLRVQRCALDEAALTTAYRALIRRPHTNAANIDRRTAFGVFVDAPFHQARASCRHYLALETDRVNEGADSLTLPGGQYVHFRVHGDLDALSAAILAFKTEQLDPSPYDIGSTLAFEQLSLPADPERFDYRQCSRELFIKVRRKREQVI